MAGGHVFPGLKQKIEAHTESIQAEVTSVIGETLEGRLRVSSLAKDMLSASVRFLNMMNEYMSTTYKELTDISKFPKAKAWLLITQIISRIFRDMNAAKKGICSVHPRTSGLTNTAKTLFAMLKIHKVMREYEELEIKNHPAVSSEYVKFLATHVGFNEARSIRDSVAEVETKIQKVDVEQKKILETVRTAKRLAKYCKEKVG
jgi:HD-GYP domain-containing protein (c-di-GMP phosphodiesterase class II)